jgi:group II intron reverse transcriptase/maturase
MKKEMTKSLPISKRMVYNSYLKVVEKGGGAGIDRESIEAFNENLRGNLYKIWNRLTSGSYFPPPVRTVFIPKKQGGERPLGIPTVGDRIAQGVVKEHLEAALELVFHDSSFGYRPKRGAHDALAQCKENCIKKAWVLDVDIKGFFDNINHKTLLELIRLHTEEKWVLMYVERWLKAGVEQKDGSIAARTKGTPQGGVISPLLANIYLHHAFDKWMDEENPGCSFERYADDIVVHCSSKEEAEEMLAGLTARMSEFDLTLHPEKTKIVYARNYRRSEKHENESFTFLSYSYQPRIVKSKFGNLLLIFGADICQAAKTSIRTAIKEVLRTRWGTQQLEWFAQRLNPKIRGWINYYTKFSKYETYEVLRYLNELIRKWMKHTYKIGSKGNLYKKYRQVQTENPEMFYHWKLGVK